MLLPVIGYHSIFSKSWFVQISHDTFIITVLHQAINDAPGSDMFTVETRHQVCQSIILAGSSRMILHDFERFRKCFDWKYDYYVQALDQIDCTFVN